VTPRREALPELALFALAAALLAWGYATGPGRPGEFRLAPKPPGALRVVTWNLGGSADDGGRALRDEHLEHVAATLASLDPNLCFVQELRTAGQLRELAEALGGWSHASASAGVGRRIAVLVPSGTLELAPWPPTRGRSLGAWFRGGDGAAAAVACVHADAYSSEDRNRELGAAVDALLALEGDGPRILAGDLNLDLDPNKRRDLFTDDEHRDVESYNYVAERMLDAARGTASTAEPDRRLDYVFVAPVTLAVGAAGPWKGRRVGDMDHDPLVVDLAR